MTAPGDHQQPHPQTPGWQQPQYSQAAAHPRPTPGREAIMAVAVILSVLGGIALALGFKEQGDDVRALAFMIGGVVMVTGGLLAAALRAAMTWWQSQR